MFIKHADIEYWAHFIQILSGHVDNQLIQLYFIFSSKISKVGQAHFFASILFIEPFFSSSIEVEWNRRANARFACKLWLMLKWNRTIDLCNEYGGILQLITCHQHSRICKKSARGKKVLFACGFYYSAYLTWVQLMEYIRIW